MFGGRRRIQVKLLMAIKARGVQQPFKHTVHHTHTMNGTLSNKPAGTNALQDFLASRSHIRHIRFYICDYNNILRVKLTPVKRALQIAANSGTGISSAAPLNGGILISDELYWEIINPEQDVWIPDWSTLRECIVENADASVMCNVKECIEPEEDWFARDPRAILARIIAEAKESHGVEFLVGHEIEFNLVASSRATTTIETPTSTFSSAALRSPYFAIVREATDVLESAGVPVWVFHGEGGRGKFEISLSPLGPLEAVDAVMFAFETIKAVAVKHGVMATFHPKAFEKGPTAGQHVHFSLSKQELADHFLAGLLEHMRALSGLYLGGWDSYHRNDYYGGDNVSWGAEWRGNPVRRCDAIDSAHFEIRMPDALSNMHLQLAATLAAGMHGIEEKKPLTLKPNRLMTIPDDEEVRKEIALPQRLPSSLKESLDVLSEDVYLRKAFGEKAFDRYLVVKRKNMEVAKGMTTEDRRHHLIENL